MATTKVNSEFIAVNAISGTIIADAAITSTHLAVNCVDSSELVTGSIDTIHIAANQVTSAKIVSDAVLTRHIADDQVTQALIAVNSVGISELAVTDGSNGQVLTTNGSGTLSFSTVSGTTINNNADNRVITGSGTANTLNGEANLTFGSSLAITKSEGAANSLNDQISLEHTSGTTGYHIKTIRAAANDNPDGIAFVENTTERMRIRGGNVGIGTDSPSTATPLTAYYSGTSQFNIGGPQSGISNNVYYNGSAYVNRNTSAGGALLQMGTDGTFAMRRATSGSSPTLNYSLYIDANGVVSAPAGIALGLGEAVTTASNVIDDYEEGTWTPAFYTYSGVTTSSITITLATYTKIGNICHIHANITCTLSSLPGQTVTITGLPFAASGSDQYGIIAVGGHTSNTGANTPKAHFRTNGSQLDGIAYNASSNTAYWTYSTMDAQPFEMSIHGFYTTA